jgi:signal transduction histidine kinase
MFVIGRAGDSVVTHVIDGKLLAPNSQPLPAGFPAALAERALGPGGGELEYRSSDGRDWLVAFEPILSLDMAVMARLDLAVINRPLRQASGIGVIASLLLIGMGVFLVRQTNVRAVQQLSSELERRLALEAELSRHQEQLEATVEQRTAELKQAQTDLLERTRLATIGQLTAKVSHELRNPLGTLRTTLHTLRGRGHDPSLERAFDRAERNVERCNRIIDELLFYTRRRPPSVDRVDLSKVLTEVLEDYQPPDNVRIEESLGEGIELVADPEDLRRITINLLNNAVAATPATAEHGVVDIALTQDAQGVCISVRDHGAGMNAELLAHAFEPLFSTRGFGVGLGLPIVRELAERNGGTVELRSSPTEGTLALVRFATSKREPA